MLRWWDSVWKLTPGRVALAYMVFGGFWILVAHLIISPRLGDSITHISFEVFVGLTFVVLTGSVLYALLRRGVVVLGESERVLATLMRNLPGIAYRRRNEPQWTMIFLSDGCRVLTGYLPGELIDNHKVAYADLILPPDRERVWEEVQKAVSAERPFELVYRIGTADGDEKWVWERGVAVRTPDGEVVMEGFIADITERRRAEQVNKLLATAVEHAGEGIIVTDKDGTILYANPAFERITGYSRQEVVGLNPRILKSGEHDESFYRQMWETIGRGEVWNSRLINRKKDGTLYEERQTISPVRDAEGETVNYVAIKRDVTEIVALETQLRQSQKMEAVGKLAGGIAHDFNNLLMAIMGHAELLALQLASDSAQRQDVEEIKKACMRAAALTRQLLTFSRRQVVRPRLLDVNAIVSDMKTMLERLIGSDIELITRLDPDLDLVRADASQIEQVIMNLAVNSRDAMANGGELVIEMRNEHVDEDHPATLAGVEQGSYVLMSVSDTGIGIRKSIQSRVFEPFFSTKGEEQGTGLGLSTVYGIVKDGGGHICLTSAPGRGTTFDIYLPQAGIERDSEDEKREAARLHKLRPPRGAETVLLVESEGPVRGYVEEMLERAGYLVLAAADPRDAAAICEEYPGTISLVITELGLPVSGAGPEFIDELIGLRPDMRVLYITDQSSARSDSFACVEKPFSPDALLEKVRETLQVPASSMQAAEKKS